MADVDLMVTIPDQHQQRVIDAFITIANKALRIEARDSSYDAAWEFIINEQQSGETLKQYGERVLKELGKAVVRLTDIKEDCDRYRSEVNSINPPAQDVPDDILQ